MFKQNGIGIFISKNTLFEGDVSIGHYSVIGNLKPKKGCKIIIGKNISIGSFCLIEDEVIIGENVNIDHYCIIHSGAIIGNNVLLLYGAKIFNEAKIGNDCIIGGDIPDRMVVGERVTFMGTVAHSYRNASLDWDSTVEASPVIGDGSIVGVHALLIGDLRIGKNCYVSAGEILKHDLPDDTVFYKNEMYPISDFKGLISTRY